MVTWTCLYVCFILVTLILARSITVETQEGQWQYFQKYGYVSDVGRTELTAETFEATVRKFQVFYHLNITGEVNEELLELMNQPRCQVGDNPDLTSWERYATANYKWADKELSWTIGQYSGSFTRSELYHLVVESLAEWESVSRLHFTESPGATIEVDFVTPDSSGYHGDNMNFGSDDLAHAFFPGNYKLSGDVHVDMRKRFYISNYDPNVSEQRHTASDICVIRADVSTALDISVNCSHLKATVVHELGHALGLDHTGVRGAVMYPYLARGTSYSGLQSDDIKGIQFLYGANSNYFGSVCITKSSLIVIILTLLLSKML